MAAAAAEAGVSDWTKEEVAKVGRAARILAFIGAALGIVGWAYERGRLV